MLPIDPVADPPTTVQPAPQPAVVAPAPTPSVAPDPALLILALVVGLSVLGAVLIRRRSGTATA